jgi:WhiB family redox-sensing transcriptional regulator
MTGRRDWNDPDLPPVAFLDGIACANVDPEIFFPPAGGNQHQPRSGPAKRVCARCPHVEACLKWALDTRQGWGVWGGTTPHERRKIIEGQAA